MAVKTANVTARVEPEIKEQAEAIMEKLGIPTSVVINMLYKQIVMKQGIPFSLTLPSAPIARDEMDKEAFDKMMALGLEQAKSDNSYPVSDVFASLRQELN